MMLVPQIRMEPVLAAHKRFEAALDRWSALAVKTAEEHAKQHVKLYSKFKRRKASRSLKDAAKSRHVGTWRSPRITVSVYADAPNYALPIEYGSRSYTGRGASPIRPKRAKFLVFFWKKTGRWMFLKKVMHPGNKPYKAFYNATTSAYRVYGEALHHGLEAAAKEF